jgi:glycosyltransferase involved in cell wall biosynthesis
MSKRILHISPKSIFPTVDGGCVAMHDMLALLSATNEVKHVCISTPKHPFIRTEYPEALADKTNVESIEIDTSFKFLPFFATLFSGKNYHASRFFSKKASSYFEKLLGDESFDFIVLESIFLTPYLPVFRRFSNAKIIVRTHNVEHLIWERLAFSSSSPIKKMGYSYIAKQLRTFELMCLRAVDAICCVTDSDTLFFEEQLISVPIQTIPVSISVTDEEVDYSSSDFFFVGAMNWKPNSEAVDILLRDVFPFISSRIPNASLHIAGSYMSQDLLQKKAPGLTIHGKVPDVKEFMSSHGIMLVPMLSGSGVRIKILEAMALGVPVISTKVGFLGLDVVHGEQVLQADSWEEFIRLAVDLHGDEELRIKLGKNARKLIQEEYNSSRISEKLEAFIHGI